MRYLVGIAKHLGRSAPEPPMGGAGLAVQVHLAGGRIVLFRDQDGQIGALIDRCPHRGVALSGVRLTPEGRIECPFHGWQFDRMGNNRHVPLNPDGKLEILSSIALPTRVTGDPVSMFTARGPSSSEPCVPDGLPAPGLARIYVQPTWRCHWTRAMENMLDSPHLTFVHRRPIGKTLRQQMTPQSRMEISWRIRISADAQKPGSTGGTEAQFSSITGPTSWCCTFPFRASICESMRWSIPNEMTKHGSLYASLEILPVPVRPI